MGDANLAAIQMTLTAENWSGALEVRSALDGRVINAGVERYRQLNSKHLACIETRQIGEDAVLLVVDTNQSHIRIAEAARTRLYRETELVEAARETRYEDGWVAQHLSCQIARGETLTVEKTVALFTGRDRAISEPALAAAEAVAAPTDFADLLASHALAWSALWDRGDIVVDEHPHRQMVLRLHIFHLLQTVSPHSADADAGVPARGLHGEAYRGHIFWDELFILPYLDFHFPEISRGLLLYRFRRLDAARRLAREAGYQGAMYPWQSGSDGREESQVLHLNPRSGRWTPDNTHLQRHVGLAIAYNTWRYWQTTADAGFMAAHGAEMLVEIARFWASLATRDDAEDRYHILGVMGPDEFHDGYPWRDEPGLDDNAYTNVMAAWVLRRAADALDAIAPARRQEIRLLLGLNDEEVASWRRIASRMHVPFLEDGVIAQFRGYDRLEELDWDAYRARYGDIQRLDRILEAEGDSVNRYKASKQADVLMLFYLFSAEELRELLASMDYDFEPGAIPRNIDYYMQRTSHGSTLSRVVHSWVLARRDRARSWQLLSEALESDLRDIQGGTTAEGIHLGAMAGSVDLVQRGQTALEFTDDTLSLSPCLPEEMPGLHLKLLYRGHWLHVDLRSDEVTLSAPHGWGGPRRIEVRGKVHSFGPGEALSFTCQLDEGWRPQSEAPRRTEHGVSSGAAELQQRAGGAK